MANEAHQLDNPLPGGALQFLKSSGKIALTVYVSAMIGGLAGSLLLGVGSIFPSATPALKFLLTPTFFTVGGYSFVNLLDYEPRRGRIKAKERANAPAANAPAANAPAANAPAANAPAANAPAANAPAADADPDPAPAPAPAPAPVPSSLERVVEDALAADDNSWVKFYENAKTGKVVEIKARERDNEPMGGAGPRVP